MKFLGFVKVKVPQSGAIINVPKYSNSADQIVFAYRGCRYAQHELKEIGAAPECTLMDDQQYFNIWD